MSQSMLLPAFVALFGVAAALCMVGLLAWLLAGRYRRSRRGNDGKPASSLPGATDRTERIPVAHGVGLFDEDDEDDDAYVEFMLTREPHGPEPAVRQPEQRRRYDSASRPARRHPDDDTEPLASRAEDLPADARRRDPLGSASSAFGDPAATSNGTIGYAHNGFHVDRHRRFRPVAQAAPAPESPRAGTAELNGIDDTHGVGRGHPSLLNGQWETGESEWGSWPVAYDELSFEELWLGRSAREHPAEGEAPRNRHHRADSDDSGSYGRHSYPE
jgi:hypothetical protein